MLFNSEECLLKMLKSLANNSNNKEYLEILSSGCVAIIDQETLANKIKDFGDYSTFQIEKTNKIWFVLNHMVKKN